MQVAVVKGREKHSPSHSRNYPLKNGSGGKEVGNLCPPKDERSIDASERNDCDAIRNRDRIAINYRERS